MRRNIVKGFRRLLATVGASVFRYVPMDSSRLAGWPKLYRRVQELYHSLDDASGDKDGVIVAELSGHPYISAGIALLVGMLSHARNQKVVYVDFPESRPLSVLRLLVQAFSNCSFAGVKTSPSTEFSLKNIENLNDLLDLEYKGVPIGNIAYDLSLREGCWSATVRTIDEDVKNVVGRIVSLVDTFEEINQKYDVSFAVSSHRVGEPGIMLRYFAHKEVPCLKGIAGQGVLRKYTKGGQKSIQKYHARVDNEKIKKACKEMSRDRRLLAEANEFLRRRMGGEDNTDADAQNAFSGKTLEDKETLESVVGISADQPCVFVLPHAFNDHPRSLHESNEFQDYYRWLIETLKFARDEESVNWIFKEHPSSHRYPNDANLPGIFEVLDAEHVTFVEADDNINAKTILQTADAVVTHRGTAGLEYPALGVPAVAVGDSHYSDLDVAHVADTKEEYFQLLGRVGQLPEVSDVQQRRARVALFLMYGVVRSESNNVGLGVNNLEGASCKEKYIANNVTRGVSELAEGRSKWMCDFILSDKEIYVDEEFSYLYEEDVIY